MFTKPAPGLGAFLLPALVALYVAIELIGNVTAGRLVQLGSVVLPGAVFLYALTFTLRDAIHTLGGYGLARALVPLTVGLNLLLAGYGALVVALPAPAWFDGSAHVSVLGMALTAVLAGVVAYSVSTLVDGWIYERTRSVLLSNVVSTLLDSLIFLVLFLGTAGLGLVLHQFLAKMVFSMLALPLVMWIRRRAQL